MNSFNMKNTSLDLELVLDIEVLQDATTTTICVRDIDTM